MARRFFISGWVTFMILASGIARSQSQQQPKMVPVSQLGLKVNLRAVPVSVDTGAAKPDLSPTKRELFFKAESLPYSELVQKQSSQMQESSRSLSQQFQNNQPAWTTNFK